MASDYGFGVSFLPNGDSRFDRTKPGQQPGASSVAPVQEAIKVLSLRMPRVVGANPLAPMALLQSRGGQGLPEGMLQQLLRTMGQMPATNPGGPMAGPGQIGIQGGSSPFASPEGARPVGFGSTSPLASVTAGGNAAPPMGGGIPPTTQGTPAPSAPGPGAGGGMSEPDPGQDLWDLAQRQRESMGRIAY